MEVIVGSPWIPLEWVLAHGLRPRVLESFASSPIQIRAGVCAFADSAETALAGPQHRAAILTTSCDQLRRTADRLIETSAADIFLFNLPSTWSTDVARDLYASEIYRLGEFLVTIGGETPSEGELATCLRWASDRRQRLRALAGKTNARNLAIAVLNYLSAEKHEAPALPVVRMNGRIPIALAGGALSASKFDLINALETAGACIAINGTSAGERALLPPFGGGIDKPLASMIAHYWNHWVDVSQRPNTRLHDWFRQRTAETPVKGLVIWQNIGCDLWRAEAPSLASALDLPVLVLENHDGSSLSARERTRIEAFLEILR